MKLKEFRETRKLTQEELGKLCGFNNNEISHYESGSREPSLENFKKICLGMNVSADALLGLPRSGAQIDQLLLEISFSDYGLLFEIAKIMKRRI